jgi:hypothetical protein
MRGVSLEGGIDNPGGFGHALMPRHSTSRRLVSREAMRQGALELRRRLHGMREDPASRDLGRLTALGRERGLLPPEEGRALGALHRAAERLLDVVHTGMQQKELHTHRDGELLTHEELRGLVTGDPLVALIVEVVLAGQPGDPRPWRTFFGDKAVLAEGVRPGLGRPAASDEVADLLQRYFVVLAKRAREGEHLTRVRELMGDK